MSGEKYIPPEARQAEQAEVDSPKTLVEMQRKISKKHETRKERIEDESRPEAADLEISDGRKLNRRKKTEILRLLLQRNIMENQTVREGETYSLECARGTDQIESVSVLNEMGIPDYAWEIDKGTIKEIKKIIAD